MIDLAFERHWLACIGGCDADALPAHMTLGEIKDKKTEARFGTLALACLFTKQMHI